MDVQGSTPARVTRTPPFAITMGDPSGIGPEIVAKLLRRRADPACVVVGDPLVMRHAFAALGADVDLRPIRNVRDAIFADGTVNVLASSTSDALPAAGTLAESTKRARFGHCGSAGS